MRKAKVTQERIIRHYTSKSWWVVNVFRYARMTTAEKAAISWVLGYVSGFDPKGGLDSVMIALLGSHVAHSSNGVRSSISVDVSGCAMNVRGLLGKDGKSRVILVVVPGEIPAPVTKREIFGFIKKMFGNG